MEKYSLTQENLAILGALDDFYDVYNKIFELYKFALDNHQIKMGDMACHTYPNCDNQCRKDVRRICEPLLFKYTYIFTNTEGHLHANEYGFRNFSMVVMKPLHSDKNWKIISFSQFLNEIQYAVASIMSRWEKTKPGMEYPRVFDGINNHIDALVNTEQSKIKLASDSKEELTNSTLFIFDVLSSTLCYKKNHPVATRKFIA